MCVALLNCIISNTLAKAKPISYSSLPRLSHYYVTNASGLRTRVRLSPLAIRTSTAGLCFDLPASELTSEVNVLLFQQVAYRAIIGCDRLVEIGQGLGIPKLRVQQCGLALIDQKHR